MKLYAKITMYSVWYNKNNNEPLKVCREIEKTWDEDSTEYMELVKAYEEETKTKRGTTRKEQDEFDKKFLLYLTETSKESMGVDINKIINIVKQCFLGNCSGAVVEYGGYIINPADFCAVKIEEPTIRINKE